MEVLAEALKDDGSPCWALTPGVAVARVPVGMKRLPCQLMTRAAGLSMMLHYSGSSLEVSLTVRGDIGSSPDRVA